MSDRSASRAGASGRFAAAALAAAALAAGVLAAMLLPRAPVGLGFAVLAAALACAAALAGRPARPARSALLGAIAVALAASAAVRDAGWVVVGELVAAVALGSLAMSAPRTWRASLLGAVAAPRRMGSGARLVAGVAARALPLRAGPQLFALGRGVLMTGVLLTIFGALFATGDRAFAQIAGDVLPDDLPLADLPLRLVVLGVVVSLAGGLAQAAAIADVPARRPLLRLGLSEWLLALGALNALFALFVAVQIAVLFGGDHYVHDSAGLTYARYARAGFAQLVVVAALTLGIVAGGLRWAQTANVRQARVLRALCLLTLVVLASALHRLGLYEHPTASRARGWPCTDCSSSAARSSACSSWRSQPTGADGWRRRRSCSRRSQRSSSGSAIPTGASPRTTSSATRRRARSTRGTWPS